MTKPLRWVLTHACQLFLQNPLKNLTLDVLLYNTADVGNAMQCNHVSTRMCDPKHKTQKTVSDFYQKDFYKTLDTRQKNNQETRCLYCLWVAGRPYNVGRLKLLLSANAAHTQQRSPSCLSTNPPTFHAVAVAVRVTPIHPFQSYPKASIMRNPVYKEVRGGGQTKIATMSQYDYNMDNFRKGTGCRILASLQNLSSCVLNPVIQWQDRRDGYLSKHTLQKTIIPYSTREKRKPSLNLRSCMKLVRLLTRSLRSSNMNVCVLRQLNMIYLSDVARHPSTSLASSPLRLFRNATQTVVSSITFLFSGWPRETKSEETWLIFEHFWKDENEK